MLDTVFLLCAIVGGATLALRTVLMLFGVGDDHPVQGADAHGDAHLGTPSSG